MSWQDTLGKHLIKNVEVTIGDNNQNNNQNNN